MTEQSLKNYNRQSLEIQPKLIESLTEFLKYLSNNPLLQQEMGKSKNIETVTRMKLHTVCLDFENKHFPGKEGFKLHQLAYKVLAPAIRENLDTDID